MKIFRVLAALFTLAAASAAHAQFYATAAFGLTDVATTNSSGSEPSINIGLGYQLNKHLGIEANYLGLGGYETAVGGTLFTWRGQAIGAAAVGTLGLARDLRLVGKAGVYALRSTDRESTFSGLVREDKHSMTTPAFALGVDYLIVDAFRVRVLAEQLNGDYELDRVRQITIGIVVGRP